MPNGKYDKWWIEEFLKKFPTQVKMEELFARVKEFKDDKFEEDF
jgi:hypothetical protein